MPEINVRPYKKAKIKCPACKGSGCSICGTKGWYEHLYSQIEGVEYEIERDKKEEEVGQPPTLVQEDNGSKEKTPRESSSSDGKSSANI